MYILLVVLGLCLSAFFSGTETGFYRVTRVRLVMDAKSGGIISRALLWLANHPSVMVSTVLIGNNIANYLVSLGLLLVGQNLLNSLGTNIQTAFPVLMTPFLFIYGELLPKFIFNQVPYRLLRAGAPFMLACTILFLPFSIMVIALEAISKKFLRQTEAKIGISIERQDIQRVLLEGQEIGVVQPIQRELAQNIFTYSLRPIRQYALPIRSIPLVDPSASRQMVLDAASRANQPLVGIQGNNKLVGYYLVSDVLITSDQDALPVQPILEAPATETSLQVLTRLQTNQLLLAMIVDDKRRPVGIVTHDRLANLLVSGR